MESAADVLLTPMEDRWRRRSVVCVQATCTAAIVLMRRKDATDGVHSSICSLPAVQQARYGLLWRGSRSAAASYGAAAGGQTSEYVMTSSLQLVREKLRLADSGKDSCSDCKSCL